MLLAGFLMVNCTMAQEIYDVSSPDKTIRVQVQVTDRIYYSLEVDGIEVMAPSPISMTTSQGTLGHDPQLASQEITTVDQRIATVWGIRKEVRDHYNQLRLGFEGGYSLLFRAFDDGVAYRFVTGLKGELIVYDEEVSYRFHDNHMMINHIVDSYTTSYEKMYTRQRITAIRPENLVSLPSVVSMPGLKLAIMEADLFSYPGMYLSKRSAHSWNRFCGKFSTLSR